MTTGIEPRPERRNDDGRWIITRAEQLGLSVSEDPIAVGDTYLAENNSGPKILKCAEVHPRGWFRATVFPRAYSYNTGDCIKIVGPVPVHLKHLIVE